MIDPKKLAKLTEKGIKNKWKEAEIYVNEALKTLEKDLKIAASTGEFEHCIQLPFFDSHYIGKVYCKILKEMKFNAIYSALNGTITVSWLKDEK